MIYLYSGTPGSGKSLYSAYTLIDTLKQGRNVIANFPIDMDYFKRCKKLGIFEHIDNTDLSVDYLKAFALEHHRPFRERESLLIIDEAAALFNSRTSMDKSRLNWITFFQQHRKLGYDIILISQSDKLLDKQIRAFIETEYRFRCFKHYKTLGFLLNFFCGGFFMRVERWYGVNLKLSSSIFTLNKRKAKIYDTFAIFKNG